MSSPWFKETMGWIERGEDLTATIVPKIRARVARVGGDPTLRLEVRLELVGDLAFEAKRIYFESPDPEGDADDLRRQVDAALEGGIALGGRVLDVVVALCAP